jgi:hypothetical protein
VSRIQIEDNSISGCHGISSARFKDIIGHSARFGTLLASGIYAVTLKAADHPVIVRLSRRRATPLNSASSESVFSPFNAAKTTFFERSCVWFLRGRLLIPSSFAGHLSSPWCKCPVSSMA